MAESQLGRPNVKEAVPFFGVTDMDASIAFYVDGLGFKVAQKWIDQGKLRWCRIELGPVALMLQEYLSEGSQGGKPEGKLGLGVTICFICEDAFAVFDEATERGLAASIPFVGNAMWVTSLTDPDGYRIDFESPTDAPEESVNERPAPTGT